VGHARTAVAFDVIVRHLRARGFDVRYVHNITDVDDKIIRKGLAEGRPAAEVARFYADAMAADMAGLGVAPADVEPRATLHIADMIDVIRRLEERGLAYRRGRRRVLFRGRLSQLRRSVGTKPRGVAGWRARRGGRVQEEPARFRPVEGGQAGRAVVGEPVGTGPAGLAHRVLGHVASVSGRQVRHPRRRFRFDLPAPRERDCPVEGAFGTFARYWMHSGMLNFGGEKMSKSLGNVVTIRRAAETHDLEALRLLLISVHYRSPAGFSIARDPAGQPLYPDLDEAEARLDYFYRTLERLDAFAASLANRPRRRRRSWPRVSLKPWTTTSTPPPASGTSTMRLCWPTSCSTIPRRRPSRNDRRR
jgi:cysteinyl-tRNA synthetase